MSSDFPPGVTGHEPEITGVYDGQECPVDKATRYREACDVAGCILEDWEVKAMIYEARMRERDRCAEQLEFMAKCLPADLTAARQLTHAAQSLRSTLEFKAWRSEELPPPAENYEDLRRAAFWVLCAWGVPEQEWYSPDMEAAIAEIRVLVGSPPPEEETE